MTIKFPLGVIGSDFGSMLDFPMADDLRCMANDEAGAECSPSHDVSDAVRFCFGANFCDNTFIVFVICLQIILCVAENERTVRIDF